MTGAVMTLREIALAVRNRRTEVGLTQAELAKAAGVSRKWIYEFEGGKSTAELGLVLRVLDVLGLSVELSGEVSAGQKKAPAELMAALEESLIRARTPRTFDGGTP